MEENLGHKKLVDISGFDIRQENRGNAALSYGAIYFLVEKGLLYDDQDLVHFQYYRNPFKAKYLRIHIEDICIAGVKRKHYIVPVFGLQRTLLEKLGIILPFTRYGKMMRQVQYEAADYGGDGFSDIYGDRLFLSRLYQTFPFMAAKIPLIVLPQTLGPFKIEQNKELALKVLKYAKKVYVRDDRFNDELNKNHIPYERTKDLSAYMQPEEWDIKIEDKSVGLNISGLAYYNRFKGLEHQFDTYPKLVLKIIEYFNAKDYHVYLIPHSYRWSNPSSDNDDLLACKDVYQKMKNRNRVTLLDKDLTSPQVKYVISRMKYFVGTRMHANFAAIYTKVPVFGLAYSYKFKGAFDANGLDGNRQTFMINNITFDQINDVIIKIDDHFSRINNTY